MATIGVTMNCTSCKEPQFVQLTVEQVQELSEPRKPGRYIQDILPTHTAAQRELFLSGICEDCWDKLFKEEVDQ